MDDVRYLRRGESLQKMIERGDFREGWNALVDMWYWWRERKYSDLGNLEQLFPHPAVVKIANRTGAPVPRFGVVQLGGPQVGPLDNLATFQQYPNFAGIVPTSPPDLARFAILLEPLLASGSGGTPVGRAAIAGAVAAQVNVTSLLHGFAAPIAGNTTYLQSSATAAGAVILTQPTQLGLQWLQVGLGRCCATNFALPSPGSSQPGCNCNGLPSQVCVLLPGIKGSNCGFLGGTNINCSALAAITLILTGACSYSGSVFIPGGTGSGVTATVSLACLNDVWTLSIYIPDSCTFQNYTLIAYTAPGGGWNGTSDLLLTGPLGQVGYNCFNFPAVATVVPGACAAGGSSGCCGSNEASITATFAGALSPFGSVPLLNAVTDQWSNESFNAGSCTGNSVIVECSSGTYLIGIAVNNGGMQSYVLTTVSCSPLHLTGTGTVGASSPCTAGGSFTVDVTG